MVDISYSSFYYVHSSCYHCTTCTDKNILQNAKSIIFLYKNLDSAYSRPIFYSGHSKLFQSRNSPLWIRKRWRRRKGRPSIITCISLYINDG